jgi:peptidoglycan/LPS O-acetylase OafA/YrhL
MWRRALRIADQHPRGLGWLGVALLVVCVAVVASLSDIAGPAAGVLAAGLGAAGAWLSARAESAPQRRAERAARAMRIERDLDL